MLGVVRNVMQLLAAAQVVLYCVLGGRGDGYKFFVKKVAELKSDPATAKLTPKQNIFICYIHPDQNHRLTLYSALIPAYLQTEALSQV